MPYQPGTHIIASLHTDKIGLTVHHADIKDCIDELISTHALQKLGEVYHDFPNGGYTAVICLSESHISIHTWPEHGLVNLDIYLSNFMRQNDGTVKAIYDRFVAFFGATISNEQSITR